MYSQLDREESGNAYAGRPQNTRTQNTRPQRTRSARAAVNCEDHEGFNCADLKAKNFCEYAKVKQVNDYKIDSSV